MKLSKRFKNDLAGLASDFTVAVTFSSYKYECVIAVDYRYQPNKELKDGNV